MQLRLTALSALLLFCSALVAQEVIDVLDNNLDNPTGMFIKDSYLYYSENNEAGTISRINLDRDVAIPQQLVINLWYPSEVMVHEDLLYVMDLGGGFIWTVDTFLNAASQRTVVDQLEAPIAPTVHNDHLYYIHYRWSDERCSIERKSLVDDSPKEVLIDDLTFLSDIETGNGNQLYTIGAEGLFKLDLDQAVPTLELIASEGHDLGSHLHYYAPAEKLFFTEYIGGNIFYLNTNEANPTVQTLISGLQEPTGLFIRNGELYFNQQVAGKISKISVEDIIISTRNIPLDTAPKIYPTPATDFIHVEGIDFQTSILIFDNLGQLMMEANINPNEPLSIHQLPAGNYFLRTATSALQQFIKM